MKTRLGLVVWSLAVLAGFAVLLAYSARPAKIASQALTHWPAQSAITHDKTKPALVIFLHPKCACSRATLAELETLLPKLAKTRVILNFYYPEAKGEEFAKGNLYKSALRLPSVEIKFDSEAKIATEFRARASGETLFFNEQGEVKFHGGLTLLRGHGGDNVGRRVIEQLALNITPEAASSRIFGCQLQDELANEVAFVN